MNILWFASFVLFCGGAAYVRAKHVGDAFNVAVLIGFAVVAGLVILFLGTRATVPVCVVLGCVCVSAASDLSSGYIYDVVTYPSLSVILLASLSIGTFGWTIMWSGLSFVCAGLLAVMTRRRGLGFGDVKLFTVVGAGLGASIAEVFGCSFVIGACVVAIGLVRRQIRFGQTVPFAPFIAVATMLWVAYEGLFA